LSKPFKKEIFLSSVKDILSGWDCGVNSIFYGGN
jgi:hypothetical protein